MKLYLTFYCEYGSIVIENIGVEPPNNIDIDKEIVYLYDWDEHSDIPLDPAGNVYEGVTIESNYKEDGVVRIRATGEVKISVNGKLIPIPDDYERFENQYKDGELIKSVKME